MTTLRDAKKSGDLTQFIAEQDAKLKGIGDLDKLDAVIRRPDQGRLKEAQAASKLPASDDLSGTQLLWRTCRGACR